MPRLTASPAPAAMSSWPTLNADLTTERLRPAWARMVPAPRVPSVTSGGTPGPPAPSRTRSAAWRGLPRGAAPRGAAAGRTAPRGAVPGRARPDGAVPGRTGPATVVPGPAHQRPAVPVAATPSGAVEGPVALRGRGDPGPQGRVPGVHGTGGCQRDRGAVLGRAQAGGRLAEVHRVRGGRGIGVEGPVAVHEGIADRAGAGGAEQARLDLVGGKARVSGQDQRRRAAGDRRPERGTRAPEVRRAD